MWPQWLLKATTNIHGGRESGKGEKMGGERKEERGKKQRERGGGREGEYYPDKSFTSSFPFRQ